MINAFNACEGVQGKYSLYLSQSRSSKSLSSRQQTAAVYLKASDSSNRWHGSAGDQVFQEQRQEPERLLCKEQKQPVTE